jgi:hypothetical protein
MGWYNWISNVAGWEIPKTAGFQSFLAGKIIKQNGGFPSTPRLITSR